MPAAAEKTTIAQGFLSLHVPDELTERLYNTGLASRVTFRIETEDHEVKAIWLENRGTGRIEDVEVGDADPFVLYLLVVIEVGEDTGRPWRTRKDAS